ncbi:MAG: VPS10 domain-containing protein, partial [Longimicrobiales bacterium]
HLRTFYVATRNGGVWKTVNNGTTFLPVFDDAGPLAIGAVAVAHDNADIVWVGTGDPDLARYAYPGNGIYKSLDGGEHWEHVGLEETHHIIRILVHPDDSNTVYVAAMGHLHGPNPDRGVFRTRDGGRSWEKVLYLNDRVGVIDLAMAPGQPEVLYAATYQKERYAWHYEVGGPGSGIYKTADGGDSWARLGGGLPEGYIGRIGLDVFRGDPNILYAVVENANPRPGDAPGSMRVRGGWGEVYRSEDAGATWRMTHDPEVNVGGKAPYSFNILRIDPRDDQRLYVTSDALLFSSDGGTTWSGNWSDRTTRLFRQMFGDIRALWIDPQDPGRIFVGSDGGVNITYDGGATVDFLPNLPIGEIYAVAVDMEDPYHLYLGLQDHESWKGPINGFSGLVSGIEDWVTVGTGDGMYQAVDPEDSRWVYNTLQFGGHVRVDQQRATMTRIQPPDRPEELPRYRYTWTTPIVLSPHDPAVVYTGAQVVLRSPDRGDTWTEISPDLTTDNPEKIDGAGNIQYCTITTLAESPLAPGVIWAGTDDGRVQLTRDDGGLWADLTAALEAAGAPHEYWVTRVVPSSHDLATAFVTLTGFHRDDFRPFVYRTDDYGATWRSIAADLSRASANVLAEDRLNPSLLFLGTDHGLFVTMDGGGHWTPLKSNMPVLPVRDIVIHPRESDLVVGTHGRGAFVTDITPLRQLTPEVLAQDFHLFTPEPKGLRVESGWGNYRLFGWRQVTTPNEPNGVLMDVYQRGEGDSPLRLRITDRDGVPVRTIEEPGSPGLHRVAWNLRDEERRPVDPGQYRVTLEAGDFRQTTSLQVKPPVVLPRR